MELGRVGGRVGQCKMFVVCVCCGIALSFSNHSYCFTDQKFCHIALLAILAMRA